MRIDQAPTPFHRGIFATLAVVVALTCSPGLVQARSQAKAEPTTRAGEPPYTASDAKTLTRLLVCLRDKKPSECLTDDLSGLLTTYRLGRVELASTSGLRRTIGTTEGERDAFLMAAHLVYKQFKKRADMDPATVADLGSEIHQRLTEVGLNQPLNAILRGGYTLADAGDEFPRKLDTGAPSLQSSALAFIDFESKHFGDESPRMDFSFGGSFGLGPALVIATRRPAEAEEPAEDSSAPAGGGAATDTADDADTPIFIPAMMTGLQWSLNMRPNARVGDQSELSFLVRFGQARLDDMTVKLGDGEDAALADVVRNGTGRWAWFKEAGVEFRIFEKPLETVHHTKDTLLPLFSFGAGYRWDERLKSTFDLDAFDDGDKRYYMRFVVNLAEVLDPRKTDNPGKSTFALKLSVDHQWKRGSSQFPSSTRIMVEAAADILKLFNLGDKAKAPAAGTNPPEGGAAPQNPPAPQK